MDGQKTLEGGAQAFHGRPDVDMGCLDGVRGNPDNKLTSWIGRFAGSQGRRGSLGFNCEVQLSGAPLSRMDEDSMSNPGGGGAISVGQPREPRNDFVGIPFGRKRDLSFSDMQTPGGDGDTFFVQQYKRRNTEEFDIDSSGLLNINKEGGLVLDTGDSDILKGIEEGRALNNLDRLRTISSQVSDEHMETEARDSLTASHYGVGIQKQHTISKDKSSDNPGIFLIDFEPGDEKTGMKMKATTKKFSASKLFEGAWAQNWFFRKDSGASEPPELMNEDAVDEQQLKNEVAKDPRHHRDSEREPEYDPRKTSSDSTASEERSNLSFVGRFSGDKPKVIHPRALREMNTWTPQGM